MNIYTEESLGNNTYIRTFLPSVPDEELKWHWDEEDRTVTPIEENDWEFQMDNELPIAFDREVFIPAGEFHRIIKGTTLLKVKIVKHINTIH